MANDALKATISAIKADAQKIVANADTALAAVNALDTTTKAATTIAFVVSPNPSTVGGEVTLTATVKPTSGSGTPSGAAHFWDGDDSIGDATLASGVAVLKSSSLVVGSHALSVTYDGDASFTSSYSVFVTQVVNAVTVPPPDGTSIRGINFYGLEYPWTKTPSDAQLDYIKGVGCRQIRLPTAHERWQPTLGGALDAAYVTLIKDVVSRCAARNIKVIVDLHNYCRYLTTYKTDKRGPGAGSLMGTSAYSIAQYADVWSKIAAAMKGSGADYDIMNEPHDMPSASVWPQAAQAAVNAIRAVDSVPMLYVEGDHWSNGKDWLQWNNNLRINDSANKIVYSCHNYWDDGSSSYGGSYDSYGATPQRGVDLSKAFFGWCKSNNFRGHVGEFGVPRSDARWLPVLDNFLAAAKAADVATSYWALGYANSDGSESWWPVQESIIMRLGKDAVAAGVEQMPTLKKYF